jgi:MATE family multidrug resistance protein
MADVKSALRKRWQGAGGMGEVLGMAYPLILSQLSFTVQTFADRLLLTWYSEEAVAGAVTALFATWALIGLFIGTGEFLTTFVAQYLGAGRPERIGPVLWQGFYFSLGAGLVVAALSPLAGPFFDFGGHAPALRVHEIRYASILMLGAFPVILMATLSTFFAGRGDTRVVLIVNVVATAVDIVLKALWIFGRGGFPRAGVAGAAWSTVISQALGASMYVLIILRPRFREAYGTLSGWRIDGALLGRLLRYGLPTGMQYSLEILSFALFMMVVGRLGTAPLAASGIAFNLNMIVFMPMLGLGMGVSALVGRHLGSDRPDVAERTTWSAFWMSFVYMLACGMLYVLLPGLLLAPYAAGAHEAGFAEVTATTVVLLRFVAVYSIFDMMNVIFAAGLRGAGDTRYPLGATIIVSWLAMLVPAYVLCVRMGFGVYVAWSTASAYIVCVGLLMMRRFRDGRWKALRVIEPRAPELSTASA